MPRNSLVQYAGCLLIEDYKCHSKSLAWLQNNPQGSGNARLGYPLHLLLSPSAVKFSSLFMHALAEEIPKGETLAHNAPFG